MQRRRGEIQSCFLVCVAPGSRWFPESPSGPRNRQHFVHHDDPLRLPITRRTAPVLMGDRSRGLLRSLSLSSLHYTWAFIRSGEGREPQLLAEAQFVCSLKPCMEEIIFPRSPKTTSEFSHLCIGYVCRALLQVIYAIGYDSVLYCRPCSDCIAFRFDKTNLIKE